MYEDTLSIDSSHIVHPLQWPVMTVSDYQTDDMLTELLRLYP